MDTVKGILFIAVLLLAGVSFVLFVEYSATSEQLRSAADESGLALQLLRAQGVTCSAVSPMEFVAIGNCIQPLLIAKDFKEDGFIQPNPDKGTSGALIIKNVNHQNYDSDRFVFYFNRNKVGDGCAIPGAIGYNVDCKFPLDSVCQRGDVLEVMYRANVTGDNATSDSYASEVKVFTKNC